MQIYLFVFLPSLKVVVVKLEVLILVHLNIRTDNTVMGIAI